jgi:hypothetical protein
MSAALAAELAPARMEGEGPAGLWEALAEQIAADGYELLPD